MFQPRDGHGPDVIRSDKIARGNRGLRAAGEQQRLCGPRAGAHQHRVALPGGADDFHHIAHELVPDANGPQSALHVHQHL